MKIVAHDNYDRDNVSEHLVCEKVSQYYVEKIVKFLNELPQENWYYHIKPDDYILYTWEP